MSALVDYETGVLDDEPLGFWPLSETTGLTAFDQTGNGRHGLYVGSFELDSGPINDVFVTTPNLVDVSYITISDISTLLTSAVTLEIWAQQLALSAGAGVIGTRLDDAGPNIPLEIGLGLLTGSGEDIQAFSYPGSGGDVVTTGFDNTIGDTHHLVATNDGSTLSLYVDGELVGSTASGFYPNTGGLYLGVRHDLFASVSECWQGRISEAAVYDYPLDAGQILHHYQLGTDTVIPPQPWPVMDFPCGPGKVGF